MRTFLERIVTTFVIAAAIFNALWWLAVPLVLWYVVRFDAYELIVVAFCIDIYFAPNHTWPYYTLVSAGFVLFGMVIRPRLRPHTTNFFS